jgi:hypothetical protein
MPDAAWGGLDFAQQLDHLKGKLNLPSATWDEVWKEQHTRAFVVAGAMKEQLVSDFRGAVEEAIKGGETLASFRKRFDSIVQKHGWAHNGEPGWRSRVIYETNLRTSYQAGRYAQMKAVANRRPYWRYRHSDASTTARAAHKAWDGIVLRHDDPWWQTHFTPNGWGCKCFTETLSEREAAALPPGTQRTAPPLDLVERKVGASQHTVLVPRGIDPGWDYNVGEAAWGRPVAERAVAAEGEKGWTPLTSGGWQEEGRSALVPLDTPVAKRGPRAHNRKEVVAAVEQALGAPQRVFSLTRAAWQHPVLVDAAVIGEHLRDLARSQFVPFIPELLESPAEVWARFERSNVSGRVALRFRYVKAIDLGKSRGLAFVADVRQGQLLGWTFLPTEAGGKLNKFRAGRLIYAREQSR